MTNPEEVERLVVVRDLAYKRKQAANASLKRASKKRSKARDIRDAAYEKKLQTFAVQESAWQNLQDTRARYAARIDELQQLHDDEYQQKVAALRDAEAARVNGDRGAVGAFMKKAQTHESIAQSYAASRRQLVEEILNARSRLKATKPAFKRARADFKLAQSAYAHAKAVHERAKVESRLANAEHDAAVVAAHTQSGELN